MNPSVANSLCTQCGLCCNGVIFARGQLQPGDDPVRLQALGLILAPARKRSEIRKFRQPCAALEGCCCKIYAERPAYCRAFDCAMLKRVLDGNLDPAGALKRIRGARRCVARVEKLLAWFGEKDPAMPLAQRFRRVQRRVELGGVSRDSELWFGELTMAVHRLNVQLSRHFYPGEADNL